MNVLVTGGTGFVGSHLVPRLIAAGHHVSILARGSHRAALPENATVINGDVSSGVGLDAALRDIAAVIHLVAVIRERGEFTFDRVNHLGTANLVRAMQRQGVRRLLHLSALGASSDARYRYTYSKWQGEEVVRASSLDWSILRPSVLFGRGSGFIQSVRQTAAPMPILVPVPGSGQAIFQPIWVEDVVTCLLLALERPETVGQTYEIGGPQYLTYDDVLDAILSKLGLRRIKVHIPLSLMRPLVALMEHVLPEPPVTSAELAQLDIDNTTAQDSVMRAFGFPAARLADHLDYLCTT